LENKYFLKFKNIGQIKDTTEDFQYFEQEDFKKISRSVIIKKVGVVIALLFFILLGIRLFCLQVQEGFINLKLAEGNRVKNLPIAAPRGLILDQNGEVLASNDFAYELVVQANSSKDIEDISEDIFNIIGISREEVDTQIANHKNLSGFVTLKEKIPRDEALILKSRLPAYGRFGVIPVFIRRYAHESLAHLLGYVGKFNSQEQESYPQYTVNKFIGKTGIEKSYDEYLQGIPGYRKVEVDASGKLIRVLSNQDPLSGNILQTTIDLDLQKYIYEKLKEITEELQTKGAVVVIDPRYGTIKAMVSLPGFDPTAISRGLSEEAYNELVSNDTDPLLNRVISGVYSSGSTIKPFIATSALEFGVIDEGTAFETPPFIEIGQWKFLDWKDHGYTDVRTAIAESNNIFFYALGGGWGPVKNPLGPSGIEKGLDRFGFGIETGVDLRGEQKGFIPNPQWKKQLTGESWYIGNTYNLAIGQGDLLVTPIQIANATSAIANSGTLYLPRSVSKIIKDENHSVIELKEKDFINRKNIFSQDNLRIVREGMRKTVTEGSAYSIFKNEFVTSVAGKTGTAQFGNEDKTHAWFTCFAPYEQPELVLTVLIEAGGEGYETAAPLAKDILGHYFGR